MPKLENPGLNSTFPPSPAIFAAHSTASFIDWHILALKPAALKIFANFSAVWPIKTAPEETFMTSEASSETSHSLSFPPPIQTRFLAPASSRKAATAAWTLVAFESL